MPWGAAAVIGGALVSGYASNRAAGKAADASQYATDSANRLSERQFDMVRGDTAQARAAGGEAGAELSRSLGLRTPIPEAFNRQAAIREEIRRLRDRTGDEWRNYGFTGQYAIEDERSRQIRELENESDNLTLYDEAQPLEGEVLPQFGVEFNYSGEGPQFEYGGSQPEFNDASRLSQFQNQGENLQSFETDQEVSQFGQGDRFEYDLEGDAGYQFARDEAIKATGRVSAAQGKRGSGNRLAEVADRVTGVASQYADQAFNRQVRASAENYGRDVNEFGLQRAGDTEAYGRERGEFAIDYGRNIDQYERDIGAFNVNTGVADRNYGRELTRYEIARGREGEGYNRANRLYEVRTAEDNREYQRAGDEYNRGFTRFGVETDQNRELYGRRQDRLNRLASMAGAGQTAVSQSASAGSNYVNAASNNLMANAQNQGNAAMVKYQGLNNAAQAGISNMLSYNQQQQNNQMMQQWLNQQPGALR